MASEWDKPGRGSGTARRCSTARRSGTTGPGRATRRPSSTTFWARPRSGCPCSTWPAAHGIAARQMAQRGAQVAGVELNARMAEIAERHGIPTEVAAFETWDPAGRTFDRVTCAQAWHWLDPEVSAGKAASVLRPGGRLCLFWNVGHYPDDLADALQAAYQRVLSPGSPKMVIGYAADRAGDPAADLSAAAGGAPGLRRPHAAPDGVVSVEPRLHPRSVARRAAYAQRPPGAGARGTGGLVRRDRHWRRLYSA